MRKLLKKAAWISAGLLVLLIAAAYLFPSRQTVEREIVIDSTLQDVFSMVNDLYQWKDWFPYEYSKPGMEVSYSNPPTGQSAFLHWENPRNSKDQGRLELAHVDNLQSVTVYLSGKGVKMQSLYFSFAPEDGKVRLHMETERNLGSMPWNRYGGVFWKMRTSKMFKSALRNMRDRAEKN